MEVEELNQSETRFRNFIAQSPVPMAVFKGPEHIIEMANTAMSKRWKKTGTDFLNKKLLDVFPELRDQKFPELLDHVYSTGAPYREKEAISYLQYKADVMTFYIDFEYTPLVESDGKISGIIVTVNDVTEKVEARKKVEDAEQRLRLATEVTQLSTWDLNLLTGQIIHSQSLAEIFGHEKTKVLTHLEMRSQIHVEDRHEIVEKAFDLAMQSGVYKYEARLVKPDNSIRWVSTHGKLFYSETGVPLKILGTLQDITEEKQQQQKLVESEQRYRELSLLLEEKINKRTTELKQTNQTFEHAEETANFGSYCYSFDRQQITYSDNLYRILGCEPNEFKPGREGFIKYIHPDDVDYVMNGMTEAFSNKHVEKWEYRLIRKDGKMIYVRGTGKIITDAAGLQWMVGTIQDITDQKQKEKLLEENQEKFNKLFQFSPFIITLSDAEGKYVDVNDRYINTLGFTREEVIGRTSMEMGIVDAEALDKIINAMGNKGSVRNVEAEIRKKSGEKIPVLISSEPISIGGRNYYLNAVNDIVERKKAEEKIGQKNEELQKMNKELQSFAYISSHDLQEPLRKIQTLSSQILEKEAQNLSDFGRDRFQRIQNAAKRMQTLIEDLLSYSRTSAVEKKFVSTDLTEIIEEVKEDLKEELLQKHAVVEIDHLCKVNIIPFQFRQLMFNMISNSLKFSNANLPPVIKIKSEIVRGSILNNEKLSRGTNYCHVTIADNGIGFEPEYNEKIFEVFQRLHGKDRYNGTGIGLAIVKKIVENHDGLITATSELNKGATFDIYFPAT
jgi:PAS domain S-box-containing protein